MPEEKLTDESADVVDEVEATETDTASSAAAGFLVLCVIGLVVYLSFFSDVLLVLGLGTKAEAIYSTTAVLIVFYGVILVKSYSYKQQLESDYEEVYSQYYSTMDSVPRSFAKWILPAASILLVLSAQVITAPEAETVAVRYELSFAATRALILLMIGMELSFFLQEHAPKSRWPVLVTASLILDFVSYFLLTAGHGPTPMEDGEAASTRALYVIFLGLASFLSSYYTITQGRTADEILGRELRKVFGDESGD